MKGNAAGPNGMLAICILLLLSESPSHGYQLIDPLKLFGFDWNGPGPLYQELHKLNTAGLVHSTWEQGRGPARRVYEPTDAGRVALATYVRGASQAAEQLGHLLLKTEELVLASLQDDEKHGEIDAGFFDSHTLVTRRTS